MQIFARITKVDEATRKVHGRAVQEVVDRSGEIFDYASSKPEFEKWSTAAATATEGKSVGNLRAMHGKIAAGKLNEISFIDAEKAIDIVTEVVDENEWQKCLKGVYTGFSIGGSYAKKWPDDMNKSVTRYTAIPSEISLVDLPCVPTSLFTVVKVDGSEELRKFETTIDDSEALAKWAEALTEDQRVTVLAKISPSEPVADVVEPVAKDFTEQAEKLAKTEGAADTGNVILAVLGKPTIEKGLWTVANFADVLQQLSYMADDAAIESAAEGDNSKVPAQLKAALKPLVDAFLAMASEEVAEAIKGDDTEVIELAAADELNKAGARHSAKDKSAIDALAKHHAAIKKHTDAMSEHMDALQAGKPDADGDEGAQKLAKAADDMQKVVAERDELAGKLEKVAAQYAELLNKAAPAKGVARAVSKDADNAEEIFNKVDDSLVLNKDGSVNHADTALKMMKMVHRR